MSHIARDARDARRATALAIALLGTLLGAGCGSLRPPSVPAQALYSLADTAAAAAPAPATTTTTAAATPPALAVAPTQAAAGFGSQRIVYIREPQQLSAYANSQWVDTPARMLAPLLVGALQAGGAFSAVVPVPGAAADLRLDTEILRLQHDFGSGSSSVRFSLRAYLVDLRTRRVLATGDFDETVASPTEDAHGGVLAAQRAVQRVLDRLVSFCTLASRAWTRDERPSTRQGSP